MGTESVRNRILSVIGRVKELIDNHIASDDHDVRYYTKTENDALLSNKVAKVSGKGLSDKNYTAGEKTKLAGIEVGAEVNIPTNLTQSRNATSYTVVSSTGGNTTLQAATNTIAGVMTAEQAAKLDALPVVYTQATDPALDGPVPEGAIWHRIP